MFWANNKSPDGKQYQCIPCKKETIAVWRDNNHYRTAAATKEWREKNRDKYDQYMREWHEKNKSLVHERQRKYREQHPEYWSIWSRANRDKEAEKSARRRAVIRGNGFERYSRQEILSRDNGICQLCEEPVDVNLKRPHHKSFSIDHIIPISKGGPDTRENVQTAHLDCNLRKWANV